MTLLCAIVLQMKTANLMFLSEVLRDQLKCFVSLCDFSLFYSINILTMLTWSFALVTLCF